MRARPRTARSAPSPRMRAWAGSRRGRGGRAPCSRPRGCSRSSARRGRRSHRATSAGEHIS